MPGPSNDQKTDGLVVDLQSATPTVSLDAKEKEVGGVSQSETRARVFGTYVDTCSRVIMVIVIAGIFLGLNYAVMTFLRDIYLADLALTSNKTIQPGDRLITTNLLMSLVGATVVQVGISTIAIVSYLFPKTRNGAD